jgi:hypothetical protein|tara:strand:+ start:10196 stop:10306 length:111 start_codon:yes stop_codon:yes gene_type:complete
LPRPPPDFSPVLLGPFIGAGLLDLAMFISLFLSAIA